MIEAPGSHHTRAEEDIHDGTPPVDSTPPRVAGAPKMPVKYVYALVALTLVLLVGLVAGERLISSTSPPAPTSVLTSPGHAGRAVPAGAPSLHASLSAFLELHALGDHAAPNFTLTDAATGASTSLQSLRGHVVVLTFANAACNDICPVLASELSQAEAQLGATTVPVTFVTVNSDPLDLGTGAKAAILSQPAVAHLTNWRFLTGSVRQLDPVWVDYHISITANRQSGQATHNDAMYFIGPTGRLAWSASLWSDETTKGTYTLSSADAARFASGIAHYAGQLAGGS